MGAFTGFDGKTAEMPCLLAALRWEFIKENKKVRKQEKKKKELDQESDQENKTTTKKKKFFFS